MDDTREDLFKEWKQMLDEWDGGDKDKPKPSKLIKLCSKVGHCTFFLLVDFGCKCSKGCSVIHYALLHDAPYMVVCLCVGLSVRQILHILMSGEVKVMKVG